MKSLIRLKGSRAVRLAASAVAVAAAIAGAAAPPGQAANVSHSLSQGVLTITGTNASDKITLRLKAGQPSILQVDVGDNGSADFSFKRKQIVRIVVSARAGDDRVRINERNGLFTNRIRTRISGGGGNDTLLGGSGAQTLLGGDGNDSLDGNRGNDLALMGSGDDTFAWDPGDGSDTVEGQAGTDTLRFNGANVAEQIDLSANGNRLKLVRDVANITMDTAGVERVDFNALGGADLVTVDDLSGTDVSRVNIELAGTLGGATGDGQPDRVAVNATNGDDAIDVSGDAEVVKVSDLAPTTEILHSEVANDRLEINTLAGTDTVDTIGLAAGAIQLFVDGVLVP